MRSNPVFHASGPLISCCGVPASEMVRTNGSDRENVRVLCPTCLTEWITTAEFYLDTTRQQKCQHCRGEGEVAVNVPCPWCQPREEKV